ncbi:MAG: hypothetical protein KIS66_09245 [Fimbriimonadaceae bacterium]|nr:hypothetical protein [Fimbriimonadaceae bacterium]
MKVALATCLVLPEPDPDEAITLEAFRRRGHHVELLAWDDPTAHPEAFDVVAIRSTWDYPGRAREFAAWVRRTAALTRLLNPAEVVLGNLDKRYLAELEGRGLPVVTSRWVSPDDLASAGDLLERRFVVKPSIGAGSMDTRFFDPSQVEEARRWLATMDPGRTFMVQPYYDSVDTVGEQSIVVIEGRATHRVHKRPRFDGQEERVEGPHPVAGEWEDLALRALAPYAGLLYARVDLMADDTGKWRISELELIEPSLFFLQNPVALEAFVDAVERMAR